MATLYELDTQYRFSGKSPWDHNWAKSNEKWVKSDAENRYFYILNDGRLFRWVSGDSAANLRGTLIDTLPAGAWADPSLLVDAKPDGAVQPPPPVVTPNGATLKITTKEQYDLLGLAVSQLFNMVIDGGDFSIAAACQFIRTYHPSHGATADKLRDTALSLAPLIEELGDLRATFYNQDYPLPTFGAAAFNAPRAISKAISPYFSYVHAVKVDARLASEPAKGLVYDTQRPGWKVAVAGPVRELTYYATNMGKPDYRIWMEEAGPIYSKRACAQRNVVECADRPESNGAVRDYLLSFNSTLNAALQPIDSLESTIATLGPDPTALLNPQPEASTLAKYPNGRFETTYQAADGTIKVFPS